jgi:hypothetical protein
MFTPAIFTKSLRRTIQAWGNHGFMPKPKTSSAQNQTFKLGDNIQKLSRATASCAFFISNIILASTNVQLPLGLTGSMNEDIVTCILFVIQDMQEGYALCGLSCPSHATNSTPLSILKCQLHTVRFSLFHMLLFVGCTHGNDCG